MSKYSPLGDFLRERGSEEIPMSFEEIEAVLGGPLPPRAPEQRAWWSNNPSNNVMTKVWLDAGYRTERVDVAGRRLVFRRAEPSKPTRGERESRRPPKQGEGPAVLDRLWDKLAGTVTVAEGVDLTEPTGEVWDAEIQ